MRRIACGAWIAGWLACAGFCVAQTPSSDGPGDVSDLSLEALKKVQVYSASSYLQDDRKAPSSVTVVTAEEIRRCGYRTLAEILRNVRGFYVTNDRNYSYLGVRGFSRPGDYNSRVLVLLNGHRLRSSGHSLRPDYACRPFQKMRRTLDRFRISSLRRSLNFIPHGSRRSNTWHRISFTKVNAGSKSHKHTSPTA